MSMYDGYSKAGLIFGGTGGGGGGTSDYTRLNNLPKINGTTVIGDLDADALGLANCKYYTLVVANEEDELDEGGNDLVISDVNKFVDANGTEIAIADVYRDMAQFVSADKSNLAIINVTFANDEEETGDTVVVGKLYYSSIDTDEGGLQFYTKAGNVELTSLVTEDEVTFNMRDVDFIVRGILTMTSDTSATISDLTADYEAIVEALDNGSNVKLFVADNTSGFEYECHLHGRTNNFVQFSATSSQKIANVVIKSNDDVVVQIISLQPKYIARTVTLASADWSSNIQTVNVSGIKSSSLVQVSPVASDVDSYAKAKIICTAQENGTLTFTCGSVPANDINVTVVNWG